MGLGKIGLGFLLTVVFSINLFADEERFLSGFRKLESLKERLVSVGKAIDQVSSFDELATVLGLVFVEFEKKIPVDFDRDEVDREALALIQTSFSIRLKVHDLLQRYEKSLHPQLMIHVSNFQRLMRSIEDHVGEYFYRNHKLEPKAAFEGEFPFLLWDPRQQSGTSTYVPQAGDVFMTRGTAVTSAAIARMGDRDGQFTHQAIVHLTTDGRPVVPESHLETGNDVSPWSEFIDKKGRVVVFRHRNPEYGRRAAQIVYDRLMTAKKNGKLVPYDFRMRLGDEREFYCSELVQFGFLKACAPMLPETFYNSMDQLGSKLLKQLGVQTNVFLSPSDMELDPNFNIVAEWRDFGRTRDIRQKDAIMTALFRLVEKEGYVFNTSTFNNFVALVLKILRVAPIVGEYFEGQFPTNMPHRTLSLFLTLRGVVGAIADEIKHYDDSYLQGAKVPPPFPQLVAETTRIVTDRKHALHAKIARYFKKGKCAIALADTIEEPSVYPFF